MKNNMDRYLATFFTFLVGVSAVMVLMVLMNYSSSLLWLGSLVLSFVWTIGLGTWVWGGFKKNDIGWRGQLLYLAQRMNYFLDEGWRWVPFPFGMKSADCRQVAIKLDRLAIITKDGVEVNIDGTIFREIYDLNKYFGVDESSIKGGLDDIWDQTIRINVRSKDVNKVLDMHEELGTQVHGAMGKRASEDWGIKILRVVVPGIKPDPKVLEDMELKKREKLQQAGQAVEIAFFEKMVKKLMRPKPKGAGLTREQSVEQVQLAIGRASKTIDAKTIALDFATAEIVAATIAGRK